jgi:hypothetical protein
MKTLNKNVILAMLLLLAMAMFAAPVTIAEEALSAVPAEVIVEAVPVDPAPALPTLAEIVAQSNPTRSAEIAVSYNGLSEVYAGDTVTLVAKLSGYEGLAYTIYWQSFAQTMVDGQEAYAWSDGEGLTGSAYSLILTTSNAGVARRVKIVITGIEGVETTGTVKDFSDERTAIQGNLAARPDTSITSEIADDEAIGIDLTETKNIFENIQDNAGETENDVEQLPNAEVTDATLPVNAPVTRNVQIITSLGSVVNQGDAITMTGVLTGFDSVQVLLQWQVNDGTGWKNIEGATGTQYVFTADGQTLNSDWRLIVTIAD